MTEFDFEGPSGKPKRGRPATGRGVKMHDTIPADLNTRVEAYAAKNFIARGEAVRQLLERGLDDQGS